MKKKYYAVAKGRIPGIYFTWDDCRSQIQGYSGAVYKSFQTIEEAEQFIRQAERPVVGGSRNLSSTESGKRPEPVLEVSTKDHLVAYVDGSYEHSRKMYAYGCAIVLEDQVVTLNGCGADEDMVGMRNVAGEILGSQHAVLWAVEHGYPEISIYYDYEGVEKWATGIWKANKPGTKRYQAFMKEYGEKLWIHFVKVAAHTGVQYNEMADRLAKQALGL